MSSRKLVEQTIGLTLVVLLLAGCERAQVEPTATWTPVSPITTPTPVPPTATPVLLTHTPAPTTGQVKGVLVGKATRNPVKAPLTLIPVEMKSDGSFTLPLNPGDLAIEGNSDDSGAFLFEDLQPGHYAMSTMIGGLGAALKDQEGDLVIIQVEAGQIVDLGEIPVR